jgi:hypothetical protein
MAQSSADGVTRLQPPRACLLTKSELKVSPDITSAARIELF